jgi:tetratricopeptide (TPR) repeat protein
MRHFPPPAVRKPNWDSLQKRVTAWLPDRAQEITMRIKINYYNNFGDWPNFEKAIVSYMKQYSRHMDDDELNTIAWSAFEHCADMTCVSTILDWSRQLKNSNTPMFMDTYANILYKLGKKDEAISLEQKALDMSQGNDKSSYQSTIDKMKAGQKTWN